MCALAYCASSFRCRRELVQYLEVATSTHGGCGKTCVGHGQDALMQQKHYRLYKTKAKGTDVSAPDVHLIQVRHRRNSGRIELSSPHIHQCKKKT